MSANASDDGERAAGAETTPVPSREDLLQQNKALKKRWGETIQAWTMREEQFNIERDSLAKTAQEAKQQARELEKHKTNLKEHRKVVEQENKSLKKQDAMLQEEMKVLREENEVLKAENKLVHQVREEMAAEVARVMTVCIVAKARNDRTIAAMSKIFVEQQEAQEQEGITETERKVIDHCLRKLTHEERAKFLCECGTLDGGFVFRNQIRREMDAMGRSPERLAEIVGVSVGIIHSAKALHDAIEGPSQELQMREKRKAKKGKRRG